MSEYTCPTEKMRLIDYVKVFKDSLSEILPDKIKDIGSRYEKLSKLLEKITAQRRVHFLEVMREHKIKEEEWEIYWMFVQMFCDNELKNEVALVKTELDNIMNTYSVWRIVMGYTDGSDELNVELAREFPITNLLSGKILKSGKNLKTCCPFHTEKSASFFIYPDNTFYCYSCGKGGDVIKFVQELETITFPQAVRRLAGV